MGVLTKSKRADYIIVDEKTGKANWWQNLGEDWGYDWADRGVAADGPWKNIEKFGWKFRGKNVRFAEYIHPTRPPFLEPLDRLTLHIAWMVMALMTISMSTNKGPLSISRTLALLLKRVNQLGGLRT